MTETRETKIRDRFEARHVANYGAAADLIRFGDGEYQDALARYEWKEWQVAEAGGRDDGLEEAAQLIDFRAHSYSTISPVTAHECEQCASLVRSLSSKKDEEEKGGAT